MAAESNHPLLSRHDEEPSQQTTQQNVRPLEISSPIQTTAGSGMPTHSGIVTEVTQSSSNRYEVSSHSKLSSLRYSPVYKMSQNHIEELNFRLQALNQRVNVTFDESDGATAGAVGGVALSGDINPSVGSDIEKESDINIHQLESSISSLSGLPTGSSTINSPEAIRTQSKHVEDRNWRVERYETNF